MKQLLTLIAVIGCFMQLSAQEGRFLSEVFTEVKVTPNVVYGQNATVITLPITGGATKVSLIMDVYEPEGDAAKERPLVLIFHTGNFLPVPQNGQINGTYRDSSIVEYARRLAKMGYVAASCQYRQGWNPLAQSQPERALGLIQAAYRSVQDARTAIRYFKRSYVEFDNQFGVDTSRIVLWGEGTGGYTTLATSSLSEYRKIIEAQNGPGKFLLDINGDGVPETPMVVPAVHGDVEGKTVGIGIAAFGFPNGDTLNFPNHVDYSSDFQMQINLGGALADLSWVDEKTPPSITFQSPNDFFAPYEDAVLIVPTTRDPIVQVQGGLTVTRRINELGINKVFTDANIDDAFTTRAMMASQESGHEYVEGLFPVRRPLNQFGLNEGSPWQWWEPAIWDIIPHPSGGTFHSRELFTNASMSPEQARTYIDTIMGYFAPRAFAALDLAALISSTETLAKQDFELTIMPNPASEEVVIRSEVNQPIEAIELFDINGRLVQSFYNINNNYFFLRKNNLPDGVYVAKLRFKEGIVARKIIFRE